MLVPPDPVWFLEVRLIGAHLKGSLCLAATIVVEKDWKPCSEEGNGV